VAWVKKNDQSASASSSNPASTTAFSSALTNPSLIIVSVWESNSTAPATPTDTAGNTYIDCGVTCNSGSPIASPRWGKLFYALNTHTTASNVVSVSNPSANIINITALEFTGGATSSPLRHAAQQEANTGTGGGQNMTTPSVSTVNGDLIVGASFGGGTKTVGTGFTASSTGLQLTGFEYETGAGGSIAATWNGAVNSATYGAIIGDFSTTPVSSGDPPFGPGPDMERHFFPTIVSV
jgi:hypothetical protein